MKIYNLLWLCETQTCLEHKSETQNEQSNAHWRLLKSQVSLIYSRVLAEVESCINNIFSAESDALMYVCQPARLNERPLSVWCWARTTFSPSDLQFFQILSYFRNLPRCFLSHLRPFFTAEFIPMLRYLYMKDLNKDRRETHFLQNRQDGETSKAVGGKSIWPDSKGNIAAIKKQRYLSYIYQHLFFFFFLHLSQCRNVFLPLQH